MNSLSKLLRISLLIALLVLPMTACTESAMVLALTVDTPQDKATVSASPVTVSGSVTKKAEVKINDVVVPVKSGKFSAEIKLTEGSNVLTVVAKSGKDTETKMLTITYKQSG